MLSLLLEGEGLVQHSLRSLRLESSVLVVLLMHEPRATALRGGVAIALVGGATGERLEATNPLVFSRADTSSLSSPLLALVVLEVDERCLYVCAHSTCDCQLSTMPLERH